MDTLKSKDIQLVLVPFRFTLKMLKSEKQPIFYIGKSM